MPKNINETVYVNSERMSEVPNRDFVGLKDLSELKIDTFHEESVYDPMRDTWDNYKGILNSAGERIAILSQKYSLIQHRAVYDWVMKNLGDQLGDLDPKVTFTEHQGRMYIEVPAPALSMDIQGDSDYKVSILVRNSVDGTTSLSIGLALNRLVCSNGMYFFSVDPTHSQSRKHVGIGSLNDMEEAFQKTMTEFKKLPSLIRAAGSTSVSSAGAWLLLHSYIDLPGSYLKIADDSLDKKIGSGEPVTVWDVYNAATYSITRKHETKTVSQQRLHDLHKQANKLLYAAFGAESHEIINSIKHDEDFEEITEDMPSFCSFDDGRVLSEPTIGEVVYGKLSRPEPEPKLGPKPEPEPEPEINAENMEIVDVVPDTDSSLSNRYGFNPDDYAVVQRHFIEDDKLILVVDDADKSPDMKLMNLGYLSSFETLREDRDSPFMRYYKYLPIDDDDFDSDDFGSGLDENGDLDEDINNYPEIDKSDSDVFDLADEPDNDEKGVCDSDNGSGSDSDKESGSDSESGKDSDFKTGLELRDQPEEDQPEQPKEQSEEKEKPKRRKMWQ